MNLIKITNPSKCDIISYKIEEAEIDSDGNVVYDNSERGYKWTGRTMEWSLASGESKKFPEYVARYLMEIFEFLELTGEESAPVAKKEAVEETPVTELEETKSVLNEKERFVCKYCGKSFDREVNLGRHMGMSHAKELANL